MKAFKVMRQGRPVLRIAGKVASILLSYLKLRSKGKDWIGVKSQAMIRTGKEAPTWPN